MSGEIEDLAEVLLGASPPELPLLEAAREAAEAILHLHRVQTTRRRAEEAAALLHLAPLSGAPTRKLTLWKLKTEERHPTCRSLLEELRLQASEAGYVSGTDLASADGILSLLYSLGRDNDVRRLQDYERRALSRRRTALRRLDYERIEAERRKQRKPNANHTGQFNSRA
jgi:hypothetical protein